MPPRVALEAYLGSGEAPPSYDVALTPQEFEQKAARVAEETSRADYYDSGSGKAGKLKQTQYDEFEDWDDAKFEAAAAAYQARLARQRQAANAASGSSSSGSNYRAQSPRRDETRSSVMPDMPASSFNGAKPNYTHQNAGQLPAPSQIDHHGQRMLPQRPTDVPNHAGPSSPPRPRTSGSGGAPVRSATSPPPPLRRDSYSNTTLGWGSPPNSQDGHGRASLESLPPFANMDPLMAQSPTEYEPPSGGSGDASIPYQTLPQQQYQHQQQNYSAPPTARPNFSAVPPPPLSIPHQQQQSASSTPQTTSSATSSNSLATPVPGSISHRHSEIPSTTTSSPMTAPTTPQRHSDVPSIHASSNQRAPPPTFSGPPNPMHAFDKKPFYPQSGNTASKALYASANMKSSLPSVRIDLNKLAYHGHTPPSAPEEPVTHQSLYSASVQSHLPAKRTAPMPPPRRTNTTDTQFSTPQSAYDQRYTAQNQPYGQPYGNTGPGFYGDSGNRPATQYPNQGVYQQPQQTQMYPTSFQSQLPLQQTQELPPQAYQPPPQNYWAPNPGMWQNYGH
ncbi:hypothetical protein CPB86DRAFT_779239 [Serendipita vermifera]|nr:hypothetical protein CPB86DRAFT_779239 [Serendipita vermifera]